MRGRADTHSCEVPFLVAWVPVPVSDGAGLSPLGLRGAPCSSQQGDSAVPGDGATRNSCLAPAPRGGCGRGQARTGRTGRRQGFPLALCGGQWPKVLGGAPLGTLPVSLSMKWSVGPSPTVKISNPGISRKMPSFPKRKQKPFNRTGPCFHPWFPSSLVDLTESGGGSGLRWAPRGASRAGAQEGSGSTNDLLWS